MKDVKPASTEDKIADEIILAAKDDAMVDVQSEDKLKWMKNKSYSVNTEINSRKDIYGIGAGTVSVNRRVDDGYGAYNKETSNLENSSKAIKKWLMN